MKRFLGLAIGLFSVVGFSSSDAAVFHCPSGNVTCLINAINAANANGKADTIKLEAGVYSLKAAAETNDDGPNGLPSITSEIKIIGKGPHSTVIERDPTLGESLGSEFFRIIHVGAAGSLTIDGIGILGGTGRGGTGCDGGLGVLNRGTTSITNAKISENRSLCPEGRGGAGLLNLGGSGVTIEGSIIADNFVDDGEGGGISNLGNMTIMNSTIANNFAGIGGGGVVNGSNMTILNSIITGNFTPQGGGGGISNFGASARLILSNSTIAENRAHSPGGSAGGIENFGTIAVLNSTIADNVSNPGDPSEVSNPGGGIENFGGVFVLQNTIVALNSLEATDGTFTSDCRGMIISQGNNLIGDPTNCNIDLLLTDLNGDPKLGALVGAGEDDRPGRGFFPVLAGSPVINAGNPDTCPETDQLGNPRLGICDIGAIEFHDRLLVTIDFRPRSDANKIDPNSKGKVAVAIVSNNRFDAGNVDLNTVRFGATGTEASPIVIAKRDFDRDKDRDLVLLFEIRETGIECGDTSASLTGQTLDGIPIFGSSPIRTINCKKHKGPGEATKIK